MVGSADILLDPQDPTEFSGKIACESRVAIRNDFLGGSIVWDNVLRKQVGDSFRVDSFFAGNKQ